jgi:2-polyprenyl-6-hydroxyphenyl methylase/3-demethylubiquinone-9 3-methyltransferase
MTQPPGPNADQRFVNYYAEQSTSAQTRQRFEGVRRAGLELRAGLGASTDKLDMADVGCGAGTQALLWAAEGHRARGVDISAPLIEIARERAEKAGAPAEFHVGSANKLPFADQSVDVILVSELRRCACSGREEFSTSRQRAACVQCSRSSPSRGTAGIRAA